MFLLLLVLSATLINCEINEETVDNVLFDRLQSELSRLSPEKASPKLMEMIEARDDNTHWCCKIDVPIGSYDQTRLASYQQIMSQVVHCGYSSCGLFGWSSCSKYCTQYWTETRYYAEYYSVYYEQQCPAQQLSCCANYLYVLGHCLHLSEITSNLELLQQLQQEGIVIPGLTGK